MNHMLKQEIYERVVGCGMAGLLLKNLEFVCHKDALVGMLMLLDGKNIQLLPFPMTTSITTNTSADFIAIHQVMIHLDQFASAGLHPDFVMPPHQPLLARCPLPNANAKCQRFPQFPAEIRFMIWKWAILKSHRVVQVYSYKGQLRSSAPQPPTLHANHESRCVTKAEYTQLSDQRLCFHPKIDTLYIGARSFLFDPTATYHLVRQVPQSFKDAVRHFALGTSNLSDTPQVLNIAAHLPNLESVDWVMNEEVHFQTHCIVLKDCLEEDDELGGLIVRELGLADASVGLVRTVQPRVTSVMAHHHRA